MHTDSISLLEAKRVETEMKRVKIYDTISRDLRIYPPPSGRKGRMSCRPAVSSPRKGMRSTWPLAIRPSFEYRSCRSSPPFPTLQMWTIDH